jgi:hypothetical protein
MKTYSLVSFLPVTGRTRINFFDCCAETFEIYKEQHEFERQKKIKHLGLISRVFDSSNHTRYEYLMLQCALVDMVDALNKGESQVALGSLKDGSNVYLGNGLLKAWFMLSNYGQCFNTFGDSKSLLLYLLQNRLEKAAFLKNIRDAHLRKWCRDVIDNYNYGKFNYVLAIYRLHKEYFRKPKKNLQLQMLKLLLLKENSHQGLVTNWHKLNRLRRVFKTIRDISIISIDGHYTHTSISVDMISAISSMSDSENAFSERFMSDALQPLLAMLNEEIYLDKDIIAMQRTYEVKSIAEIRLRACFEDSISDALTKGILEEVKSHRPFLRLKLPEEIQPESTLYEEFRNVKAAKRGCPSVELMLDQNFYQGHRYLDVLVNHDSLTHKEIGLIYYRISKLVSENLKYIVRSKGGRFLSFNRKVSAKLRDSGSTQALLDEVDDLLANEMIPIIYDGLESSVSPSYKEILYSVLKYVFLDKYNLDLEHQNSHYKSFDFRLEDLTTETFNENIELAKLKNSSDVDRVHEIEVLRKQIRGATNEFVYACIDRLLVLDMSANPDKRKYTDIDGVILFVGGDGAKLEIIEAKNTKNAVRDAKKDIKKTLIPALNKARIKGYRVAPLKGKGAKLVIKF